jgi:hypothetical protein
MRSWGIFELTRRMALGLPIGRDPPPEIPARQTRHDAIIAERQRFAALGVSRTPEEAAAHVAAIDRIIREGA